MVEFFKIIFFSFFFLYVTTRCKPTDIDHGEEGKNVFVCEGGRWEAEIGAEL